MLGIITPPSCPTAQLSGYIYTFSPDTETQAQSRGREGEAREGGGRSGKMEDTPRNEGSGFVSTEPPRMALGQSLRVSSPTAQSGGSDQGRPSRGHPTHDWPEGERPGCGGGLWASPTYTPS